MTRSPALLLVLLGACQGYPPTFDGSPVWSMFPFDGERSWTYISTDQTLAYKLVAWSSGEPELKGGKNIYTVEYSTNCFGADPECVEGEILRKVKWSSDVSDGVFIHAYALGSDAFTDLDPPVQLTPDDMKKGDVIETTSNGATWSSTMNGISECPVSLSAAWDECGEFALTTDAGDGYPIAGTYWATVSNGTAALELATETGVWQLSDLDCQTDVDCDGSW